MFDKICNDSSCSFNKNGRCSKLFGKCVKEIDHSKMIKHNVENVNKLRRDKAKRKGKGLGFNKYNKK